MEAFLFAGIGVCIAFGLFVSKATIRKRENRYARIVLLCFGLLIVIFAMLHYLAGIFSVLPSMIAEVGLMESIVSLLLHLEVNAILAMYAGGIAVFMVLCSEWLNKLNRQTYEFRVATEE